MAKRTYPKWVSPAAKVLWPALNKPRKKFEQEDLEYKAILRFDDPAEIAQVKAELDELHDQAVEAAKSQPKPIRKVSQYRPYKMEENDEGVETGALLVTAKLDALVAPKNGEPFKQCPTLVDAAAKPINPSEVMIGGGSTIKIACEAVFYANKMVGAGVSLRLRGAQVLDLVEYNAQSAESLGFTAEEGYEAAAEADNIGDNSEDDAPDDAPDF